MTILAASGHALAQPATLGQKALATKAHRDAMLHMAQDIPDPAEFARDMPEWAIEVLLTARLKRGAYCVSIDHAKLLRPFSVVEAGVGRYLTAFGCKVLRALKDEVAW